MYRDSAGQLAAELERGDSQQAKSIAEVLQRVRPDIVLLNEFDYEPGQPRALRALLDRYLSRSQQGLDPIEYPHYFYEPVNTGVDSKMDLDGDGKLGGPADAWGYGRYPGQYGMLLLSRLPIKTEEGATVTGFQWKDLPDPSWPRDPESGEHFYDEQTRERLLLPSKGFWHCPVELADGKRLHLLCSHPTPPVFDGPEDRNGCRNYDEIRMLAYYLSQRGRKPFADDSGESEAGLPEGAAVVVLGDLNADPVDGGGRPGAIEQLLEHPAIDASFIPKSEGAAAASRANPKLNAEHRGEPSHDTADFGGDGHSNLRVDYVLPSRELKVLAGGVFWPKPGAPGAEAIKASDHRLVWIDVVIDTEK